MGKPKIFVLDTNVILHDHKAIRKFQDNHLVIPVAVIEEVDKFKKGNDALSYNARGFMRDLDRITNGKNFGADGLPIGKDLGCIKVEPNHPFEGEYAGFFADDIPDHRILATAMWVRDHHPDTFVALVTKDINLRMKAKAIGMAVQDYLTDKVGDDHIEEAQREVQLLDVDGTVLQELAYGPDASIEWKRILKVQPKPNQMFKFRWEKGNDELVLLNPKVELVSLTGGAGTGKTLLALAAALEQERDYEQIYLSRPTVILGNQDLGFLPGDQKQKMGPFLQPLMDNLNVIKSQFRPTSKEAQRIEAMLTQEKLIIEPLAYIRGRSLGRCFFIVDEAQNLTPHEVKTIITRAGEGTKMVFTGDIFQIDQPYLDQWSNGLTHLGEKMAGQEVFQHVFLRKGERSTLSELAAKLL